MPLDQARQVDVPMIRALKQGVEDAFVGDVAEDVRQRLAVNPKALEREMAG